MEEPDIWAQTPDQRIALWIDMGEPSADRIKKAARKASAVKVYAFHFGWESWWRREQSKFKDLDASVFLLEWAGIQALAGMVRRTMDLSVTISEGTAYVSCGDGECEIACRPLQVTQ